MLLLLFPVMSRTCYILYKIHIRRYKISKYGASTNGVKPHTLRPAKTLVVLGSGGHTSEMQCLIKNLPIDRYTPLIAVIANTDTTSQSRIEAEDFNSKGNRVPDVIYRIPRSREVGQLYLTSIISTLYAMIYALFIVACTRPELVICNGPGTCVPIVFMTFVFRVLGLCRGNIVFVESFCRVESLSLTGKLVFPFVDRFIIHWSELQNKYPQSELIETFVRNGT